MNNELKIVRIKDSHMEVNSKTFMQDKWPATMLVVKRLAVGTPEVNCRRCTLHTPLPSRNEAAH